MELGSAASNRPFASVGCGCGSHRPITEAEGDSVGARCLPVRTLLHLVGDPAAGLDASRPRREASGKS